VEEDWKRPVLRKSYIIEYKLLKFKRWADGYNQQHARRVLKKLSESEKKKKNALKATYIW
jgi:hypothetical protein